MSENFRAILEKTTANHLFVSDDAIVEVARTFIERRKASLNVRTVSAYQKAILESEYDALLLELI